MARDACPGPEFLSMRRNGVPALASHRARTSPVGPAPTIRTCGWVTALVPGCAERNRSVIVGELAGGVKGSRTEYDRRGDRRREVRGRGERPGRARDVGEVGV